MTSLAAFLRDLGIGLASLLDTAQDWWTDDEEEGS